MDEDDKKNKGRKIEIFHQRKKMTLDCSCEQANLKIYVLYRRYQGQFLGGDGRFAKTAVIKKSSPN
jgi:hypothetical protein